MTCTVSGWSPISSSASLSAVWTSSLSPDSRFPPGKHTSPACCFSCPRHPQALNTCAYYTYSLHQDSRTCSVWGSSREWRGRWAGAAAVRLSAAAGSAPRLREAPPVNGEPPHRCRASLVPRQFSASDPSRRMWPPARTLSQCSVRTLPLFSALPIMLLCALLRFIVWTHF